eukprot:CAMPEP_0183780492 /NCGR_PEP_ID=MMETSP0739-20130205/56458_1 /TAXON_ID=385413 /ORGANISM="Thalassiosira miniscula, Strain CCMP1093" /LENGTH=481 /DNA_ID=CAMNT_0026023463 /DNA_START=172 /DNA_END=1617 /DNA_ORIENTATION=-
MKITKFLLLLGFDPLSSLGAASAKYHQRSHRAEVVSANRQLQEDDDIDNNVFVECSWPCSLGSCRQKNFYPWSYVSNGEDVRQEFRFTLDEGTTYNITLQRDISQCAMNPQADIIGDFKDEDDFWVIDECGPSGRYQKMVTPAKTGQVTLSVIIDAETDCPREGFKYSVLIEPPPSTTMGSYVDPTCYEPPQRVFARGRGKYDSGTSDRDIVGNTNLNFQIKHDRIDSKERAIPFHQLISFEPFSTSLVHQHFDAIILNLMSTSYRWLYINEREGCLRFQGFGTLNHSDKEVTFDVIAFDKGDGDEWNKKDTLEFWIYEWYVGEQWRGDEIYGEKATLLSGDIEYSNCDGDLSAEGTDLAFVGNNLKPDFAFPLCRCEADCDKDVDCAGDLVCFNRSGNEQVPGCKGAASEATDYCTHRPSPNYLSVKTLGLCEGDCDKDFDCAPGLFCFKRNGFTEVPGCNGKGTRGVDYCIPEVLREKV